MLTKQELIAKDIMTNFIIPALNELIQEKNPKEYERWNKNCCRQTAVFGAFF